MVFKKIMSSVMGVKDKSVGPRRAYRIHVPGLRVKVEGKPMDFPNRDLSATGVGLVVSRPIIKGQVYKVSLFLKGELVVSGLKLKVVRNGEGYAGCRFIDPDRRQSKVLHSLVLEEMKKDADLRKLLKEDEDGELSTFLEVDGTFKVDL